MPTPTNRNEALSTAPSRTVAKQLTDHLRAAKFGAEVLGALPAPSPDIDERRSNTRHRAVMRAARLASTIHKVETMGLVRNISEGGMLVQSFREFEPGEAVMISVADSDRIEGTVVWQDDNSIGIKFNESISVDAVLTRAPQTEGKRKSRAPRIGLDKMVMLRIDSYLADARIHDISQRGAKIEVNGYLALERRIQISHGDLRPISGSVKWQVGNIVGLEFHRTVGLEELAEWTAAG